MEPGTELKSEAGRTTIHDPFLALETPVEDAREERLWRLGLLYHRGRAPLGEFFRNDEDNVELGFWMDP